MISCSVVVSRCKTDDQIVYTLCSKKCKSLGGLKRHMTRKHKDELEDKETECIEEEQCKFTADFLAKVVDEVKQRIVNN